MNKIQVSVIIPTYNRGHILSDAIDSVLAQDFDGYELIVVDDGSTDNTMAVLNGYSNKIKVCKQTNQGVSAARNHGIAVSSGELIAFLDSDDLWLPKKLAVQVGFFNSTPKAMICQTQEIWIRNGVRVNPKKRHQKPCGHIFEKSLELCLVSPSAVMLRRQLFDSVGLFDESLPACEDYDLWLRISSRFPVHLIDTPLIVKKGGHADQLSRMKGLDRFRIRSLLKIINSGILTMAQKKAAISVLNRKCTIYANGCLKRNRPDEARYYKQLMEVTNTQN
ncbi:glycosyltransferase [Desulfococcaceae bacterium HSG9]|nr:glycosyltransferase [Desulfococcaceae bacterium HSG9]